jgi:hypothetical protein
MVDKVEITTPETGSEAPVVDNNALSKPEGLPEKFNSVEDLAKSYSELEAKLGTNKEEVKTEEVKTEEVKTDGLDIAEKAVSNAGLDMNNLAEEYAKGGKLEDTSYEALEKAGIPKDYVDQFIQGQKAISDQQSATMKNLVGGDDAYTEMSNWAADNMNDAEKTAYNAAVNSKDIETAKLAVVGLKAKYEAVNGSEPNLVQGKATPMGVDGYQSWQQVTEAMKDPRYAKDPAYQNMVKNKLSKSTI